MGKLITGIVVVFTLQLAFVLYLRSGADIVELAQLSNMPSSDVVRLTGELERPESSAQVPPNETIYEIYEPPVRSIAPTTAVRGRYSVRVRPRNNFETVRNVDRRPSRLNEPTVSFVDRVIIVERDSVVPTYQADAVVNASEDLIPKTSVPNFEPIKRSPFMRVRSFVRKPYDWARSFTSKIF